MRHFRRLWQVLILLPAFVLGCAQPTVTEWSNPTLNPPSPGTVFYWSDTTWGSGNDSFARSFGTDSVLDPSDLGRDRSLVYVLSSRVYLESSDVIRSTAWTNVWRYLLDGRLYGGMVDDSQHFSDPLQPAYLTGPFPDTASETEIRIGKVAHHFVSESKFLGRHIENVLGKPRLVDECLTKTVTRQDSAGVQLAYYNQTLKTTFSPDLGYTIREWRDEKDSDRNGISRRGMVSRVDSIRFGR